METYQKLNSRHHEEFNAFPIGFAFSNEQFVESMRGLGLEPTDTDKVCKIGCGGFIRKTDTAALSEMVGRHDREMKEAIASDKDGSGFVFQMFLYELRNHEYGYTGDAEDTLESLGYTFEQVESDPKLKLGFEKAKKKIQQED